MKNIKIYLLLMVSSILITACNDEEFLETAPKDELSVATMFSTYNNIKTYAWSFYEFFDAHGRSASWAATKDLDGDLMMNGRRPYIYGEYNIPTSDSRYTSSYSNIRKVNIMLDNLYRADLSEEDENHWRGVGLFFRAHEYFTLLSTFGGVTWIENELTDLDTDLLFGPRDSRDLVADNILRDLSFAAANIKENGDGSNTVNKDVAKALLSRFSLFEGTWRKYHGLPNPEKFLNACIQVSAELVNDHPVLMSNYDHVFNSIDLSGKQGILLYKHYVIDELTHWVSTNTRSTNNNGYDLTRKGVDKFLTKNGLPIRNTTNTQFLGDTDFNAEFKNRDDRLLLITPPPYKVTGNGAQDFGFLSTDPAHPSREYFPILEAITTGFPFKNLPDRNWSGRVSGEVPNFTLLVPNQTRSGYRFWKVWNEHNLKVSSSDISDEPLFRIGEVMLNYAEAAAEMGQFNQTIADATISKLRARGNVAPMNVGIIDATFDPDRDSSVDHVLWEIRRERAVELMGDGYRREDLRRWKKMDYATEVKLGRWITKADYPTVDIYNDASVGYVQAIEDIPGAFPEHYYLYPIPSNQIVLNDNLVQNPGW